MSDEITELRAQFSAMQSQQGGASSPTGLILSVIIATCAGGASSAGVSRYSLDSLEQQVRVLERQISTLEAERKTLMYRLQHMEASVERLGEFRLRIPPQTKVINPRR